MNHHSVIIIPCFFVITLVYAISTATTTTAIAIATTSIPIEQQLQQQRPDRESDENEPIKDLPIIDSPCKSSCPPNYKLIYSIRR